PGRPRPDYAPPPREESRRDEIRERMFALRAECEDGNRRACVRLGIIIGEHREHRAAWRREHPDLFWWESSVEAIWRRAKAEGKGLQRPRLHDYSEASDKMTGEPARRWTCTPRAST